MDKYNPKATCPKCGGDDMYDQYIEKGRHCNLMDERPYLEESVIKRHCRNCHYEWKERPLDEEEA